MPQQQLHHPQVRAMVQQMRGKRMSQDMGREWGVDSCPERILLHELPEGLAGHGAASACDEQRVRSALSEQRATGFPEIALDPMLSFSAHGHQSVLAALALRDPNPAVVKTDFQYPQ